MKFAYMIEEFFASKTHLASELVESRGFKSFKSCIADSLHFAHGTWHCEAL